MKKLFFLLIVLVLSIVGCSESTDQKMVEKKHEEKKEEEQKEVEEKEPKHKEITKSEIEDKLRGVYTLGDYEIYLYSKDETEEGVENATFMGDEGDTLYKGTYRLALGQKGEDILFEQEQITLFSQDKGFEMTFNGSRDHAFVLKGDQDFFVLMQDESTNLASFELYTIKEGELIKVKAEEGPFSSTGYAVKYLNDHIYQTMHYNNNGDEKTFGWHFRTWKYDYEKGVMTNIEDRVFNKDSQPYGAELGQYHFEKWFSHDNYYVAYKDLDVTKAWIGEVKQGKLPGTSVPLDTTKEAVIEEIGDPHETGYYEGGFYLGYSEAMYILFEERHVGWIAINGYRIKQTMDKVKTILGKPSEEGYNEMNDIEYATYYFGGNRLMFEFEKETGEISMVWMNHHE